MQRIAVYLVAGVFLRKQQPSTLGTGDPAATDALADPPANTTGYGPPDLPAVLEVVSPDKGFVVLALDNWTAAAADLAAAFAAVAGVNATRFTITTEMDAEQPAPLNFTAMAEARALAAATPATPATPTTQMTCHFVEGAPEQCLKCRDCFKGTCAGSRGASPACRVCDTCSHCEDYFSCSTPTAAAAMDAAAKAEEKRRRAAVAAAVPPPILYFFNVTIAPDPAGDCPHSGGPGLKVNNSADPKRCPCIDVVRAENVSAALLAAMQQAPVGGWQLDGRVAGVWQGAKRFMAPAAPPNNTDTLAYWTGGAPVTPGEALALSNQTSDMVADFVVEQAQAAAAAQQAMQMPGQIPCSGTVKSPLAWDGTRPPYPCREVNQETPEVPTH